MDVSIPRILNRPAAADLGRLVAIGVLCLLLGGIGSSTLPPPARASYVGAVGPQSVPVDTLPATRAHLSTDSVSVGDRFTLSIVTRHLPGRTVALRERDRLEGATGASRATSGTGAGSTSGPRASSDGLATIGDLEVLSVGSHHVRRALDGSRIDSVALTVTTFTLDSARVAPLRIRIRGETDTLEVRTRETHVRVGSLVASDAREPKDLAALASFPAPLWPWAAGAAALLVAVATLLYLLRDRDEEREEEAVEPAIDPYEEAADRLHALEDVTLEDPSTVKPFFVELSDCLRTLTARITALPAREMTSRELIEALRAAESQTAGPFSAETIRRLDVILRLCDLAKFADARPDADDSRSALDAARTTVHALQSVRSEDSERTVDDPASREAPTR